MIVIDGRAEDVAGLRTASYLDVPAMAIGDEDKRPRRTRWVRSLILHTTMGDEPQVVRSGSGPRGMAARTVANWRSDKRHAGSHLIIDGDGTVWCLADLVRDCTYHATTINEVSVGIEIAQSRALEVWDVQLQAAVALCDALTWRLGIQRQYHSPYRGEDRPVARLAAGGEGCVGVFGHRDQTTLRGPGDPGDAVFGYLHAAGYEAMDLGDDRDLDAWRDRQRTLALGGHYGGMIDGIAGPATVAALRAVGYPGGMWRPRPGDPR